MEVVERTLRRLKYIKENLYFIITQVAEENKSFLEDANIEQLLEGMKANGERLPNYSFTSIYKFGKPPGPMILKDTGRFHAGIKAKVFVNQFEMIGLDSKTEMLLNTYGRDVLGVDVESDRWAFIVNEVFLPATIMKMEEILTM